MKKNHKFIVGYILLMLVLVVTGCDKGGTSTSETSIVTTSTPPESKKSPISITCDIRFAKTVDEKYQAVELYEDEKFKINTKIYVIVDFSITNKEDNDIPVEFKIQIPYAKYYSAYEYKKGVIKPKAENKEVVMDDGNIEETVELSEMKFVAKTGGNPFDYSYCFCIEASQICEDVQFKAMFSTEDGFESTFTRNYSFVQ